MRNILLFVFTVASIPSVSQHSYYATAIQMGTSIAIDTSVTNYSNRVTAAGGSLSVSELRAYDKFANNAKASGVWPYILDMCFFSGGYQGMLVKLKIHPSLSYNPTMDASAGTSMVSGNFGTNGGLVFLTGNIIKTRLTLADIPFNNFGFTHLRPSNSSGNNSSDIIFGNGNSNTAPTQSLGFFGNTNPSYCPSVAGSQFGVPYDNTQPPWFFGNFTGVFTINHFPVSGTRYTMSLFNSNSKSGYRDEDNGTLTFGNSNPIQIKSPGEQYPGTYSTSGYCITSGMPDATILLYQNLILTLHQDLGRNDLTYVRDIARLNITGDSYTAGVGASGVGNYYPQKLASSYNPNITFVSQDGISGETIGNYQILFNSGHYNYKNGFHKSSRTDNNYVAVELGTNDCGFSPTGSQTTIKANLDTLMMSWKAIGWKPIYITPVQSVNTADGTYTSRFNSNSPALISLVTADSRYTNGTFAYGILRLDTIVALQNPLGPNFSDGLHPGDGGYDIIANRLSVLYNQIANPGTTSNLTPISGYTVSDGFFGIQGSNIGSRTTELGSKNWTVQSGSLSISKNKSNTISPTSGSTLLNTATVTMPSSDGSTQIDILSSYNSVSRLIIRYQDNSNYMFIQLQTGSSVNYTVYKIISGSFTAIVGPVVIAAPTSGIYTLRLDYSGNNFNYYINSNTGSFTDANSLSSNTKVGYSLITGSGYPNDMTADNFSTK